MPERPAMFRPPRPGRRHVPASRVRGSAASRGYDADWEHCRAAYLLAFPLCADCQAYGRVTAAREVHHLLALRDGGERLDWDNLMALCKRCHSKRTARGE